MSEWLPKSLWQKMETAPRDGTEFQAWVRSEGEAIVKGQWEHRARFNPETEAFELWGRTDYDHEDWGSYSWLVPTHWMPKPTHPEA